MDPTIPTIQYVNLLDAKPKRPRNNLPGRGDYPELSYEVHSPAAAPEALLRARWANKFAEITRVTLPSGEVFQFPSAETERRVSRHVGTSSLNTMTLAEWLEKFCEDKNIA
jgi:hypothetical protein